MLLCDPGVWLHSFPALRLRDRQRTTDSFVADLDATLVQQILDIAQRQREADVEHHRQTDDLGAGFDIAEGAAFCHSGTLFCLPAFLKSFSSDNAHERHPH